MGSLNSLDDSPILAPSIKSVKKVKKVLAPSEMIPSIQEDDSSESVDEIGDDNDFVLAPVISKSVSVDKTDIVEDSRQTDKLVSSKTSKYSVSNENIIKE